MLKIENSIFFFLLFISISYQLKISDLESSSFGLTVIDTLHISFLSGQSIDSLSSALNSMSDEINKQYENYKQEHSNFLEQCQKELNYYTKEIESNENNKISTESKKNITLPQIEEKQNRINLLEDFILGLKDQLNGLILERKEFNERILIDKKDYEDARENIAKIKGAINSKKEEFLERKIFFKNDKTTSISKFYKNFENILQMTLENKNKNGLNKIKELCEKILRKIDDEIIFFEKNYKERDYNYQESISNYEENIKQNEDESKELNIILMSLKEQADLLKQNLNQIIGKIEEKNKQYNDKKIECDNENLNWNLKEKEFNEQSQVLKQALDLIENQPDHLKKYFNERK